MLSKYKVTGATKIATVTAVDIKRGVCKCLGDRGESYSNVLIGNSGGANYYPIENSRVVIDTSSGQPVILCSLPSESLEPIKRSNIINQNINEDDIADYTDFYSDGVIRGSRPDDQRIGDQIVSTEGGGLFGMLRSGTFIAKASSTCQMVFSRIGDLARIVSRNFEHFTDMDSTYKVSTRGRVFSIREIFRNPTKSRAEEPNLEILEGDVAAAEAIGKGYTLVAEADVPTVTDDLIVKKVYTKDDAGAITSTDTLDINGARTSNITDGTDYTNRRYDKLSGHIDVNDKVTIDYDINGIRISADGKVTYDINSSGALTVYAQGDVTISTDANATVNASGNATVDAGGNAVIGAGGNVDVTAGAGINMSSGADTIISAGGNLVLTGSVVLIN